MSDLQWAVIVVVNHTRREILAEIGAHSLRVPVDLADIASWGAPWHERNVARRALVMHWNFEEDRMLVTAVDLVDHELAARRMAGEVRRDVRALASRWPRAQELIADGYRILRGTIERTRTAASCSPRGSYALAARNRPADAGSPPPEPVPAVRLRP